MKTSTTALVAFLALAFGGIAGYIAAPAKGNNAAETAKMAQAPSKKLLYYRNPMGLPDTSPTPKKDPMGMDYIAVYEGEEGAGDSNTLRISPEKIQKLGVKTELAKRQVLDKTVHASGRIEIDESRTYTITPKFEGYIDRLHLNTTGQAVGRGQALFEVYSPELVSAQREYLIAQQGISALSGAGKESQAAMRQLAESSLQRLKNWDMSEEQMKALAQTGEPKRTLTFRSPASGVVTEKKATQGMRFMPGDVLFQIADISRVWVQADVFEQDIGAVKVGQKAKIAVNAFPGEVFEGKVAYVYPTLKAETRTATVRIELNNAKGKLKPAMFADVDIPVAAKGALLTIPNSAVIDSGRRQVVIVQIKEGKFEPRDVKLGSRGADTTEILSGVDEGEAVVISANFLIDAESNLKAALGGLNSNGLNPAPAAAAKTSTVGHQAEGTLNAIDLTAGTVTVSHGPIKSLNWPAMKMEFTLANPALVSGIQPGSAILIEFVERKSGEWVITSLKPRSAPLH